MDLFPGWPRGAVATFGAVVLAGVVALVSTITTIIDGAVSRRRLSATAARDQWWTRWSFTIEKALSADAAEREMGAVLLDVLVEIPPVPEDDARMTLAISQAIVRCRRPTDEPEGASR